MQQTSKKRRFAVSPTTVGTAVTATALAASAVLNARRARRAERDNPPRGGFLAVDGIDLHYVESGQGPPILLLHGNGVSLEDWFAAGVYQRLAASNRVIALDRPGFGHTRRPRSRLWSPAAQADLFAAALRRLGASDAVVVGHSFGTAVATAMALDHPHSVRSLVLLGGYFFPSARADVLVTAPPAIPLLGDVLRYSISPLVGSAARQRLEEKMFAPAPVSDGWRQGFPFEMSLRPSQIRAAAAEAGMMVPSAARMAWRYPELKLPVRMVAGSDDRVIDVRGQSRRLADLLPGAELRIVAGAGHMVHHTAPDEVSELIRQAAARPA